MKLYHGSNLNVMTIDFEKCKPYKDFGKGFYCTEVKKQAILMAQRVSKIYGGNPYVSEFYLNEDVFKSREISVKRFKVPSEEWAIFVLNNRDRKFTNSCSLQCNIDNKYDLVVGPVADDDLALLFRSFTRGVIDIGILAEKLKYKEFSNQYSFHTEKALKFLKSVGGK